GNSRLIKKFSTFHMGMGSFDFTPQNGKNYHVKITRPAGISATYELPESLDRGYVMCATRPTTNTVRVEMNTTETGKLSFVAQMRGKVLHTTVLPVLPGTNSFEFSTDEFPMGVLQITAFDHKGIG